MLNETTLYEILDIHPDASPQEVREAYIRIKSTFNRDNVALYTLITTEEREDALKKIEDAYLVLSDPQKRSTYDQNHGLRVSEDNPFTPKDQIPPDNIVSIDRVPPMESTTDGDKLLIPPNTDFSTSAPSNFSSNLNESPIETQNKAPEPAVIPQPTKSPEARSDYLTIRVQPKIPEPTSPLKPVKLKQEPKPNSLTLDTVLLQAIEDETEWTGPFIRKIRDAYHISLEEMASITKVSKTYLIAIEEENYPKLPAPVYIRGFITQMAKVLKLPHEKVAAAYLARYNRAILISSKP